MDYSLKQIREDFKKSGVFYTTSELAEYLKSLIDIEYSEVYDPTCGNGQLLSVFADEIKKFGQEINEQQLQVAQQRLVNFNGYCGDTLKDPHFLDKKFKCIVANPPFSIKWEPPMKGLFIDERFSDCPALPPPSKADYAFMLHCLHYLSDDGIAVILNFPGILYRGASEGNIRKWLVQKNWIDKVIRIPGKTFVDTTIETCIIVFKKNKSDSSILFIDTESSKQKLASLEDIVKNDYILSVNTYIEKDEESKPMIDPLQLQEKAHRSMILRLKKNIEMDKMICELEGWDFVPYLLQLQETIKSYLQK